MEERTILHSMKGVLLTKYVTSLCNEVHKYNLFGGSLNCLIICMLAFLKLLYS